MVVFYVGVPHELLHGPNALTRRQKVCGEGVSLRVRRGGFGNARPAHGLVYSSLDDLLSEMMPPLDSASWVDAAWKDPLPRPRGIRGRDFTASASGIQTLPN